MKETRPVTHRWRKLFRFVLYTIIAILILVIGIAFALTLPSVQQRITKEAQGFLQKKLGTHVEIGAIRLRFPYAVSLQDFLLEDQQGDTLVRVGNLAVSVDMWKLLDQTIELKKVMLEDASVYLNKKDSIYNFDFIVNAFSNPNTPKTVDTTASSWGVQMDLTKINLKSVDFFLQDGDLEAITQAHIGAAETVIAKADLSTLHFELDGFQLDDSDIRLIQKKKSIPDGKPGPAYGLLLTSGEINHTTLLYSTPEMYVNAKMDQTKLDQLTLNSFHDVLGIQAKGIEVTNSAVAYRDPLVQPTSGHLNAGDLDFTSLNAELPAFSFQNDTLFVQADALSGNDKSGLQVHTLQATAQVTPGSISINHALASLNQTSLDGDVFLYKNKQDEFNRMQVQLRQVKGILGDLILLLPPQENTALSKLYDMPYSVSGNLYGWLDNLQTQNIQMQAGTGTVAHFTGSVQQLTTPEKLGMQLNISRLETNRADLVRWMSVGDTPMDSLLAQPLPAHLSASGQISGAMSSLQLAMNGTVNALQTGPDFPPDKGQPLQFNINGTLSNASDLEKLGMDLQIQQLDVPADFFAFMQMGDVRPPDMLKASGTLKGTLAALQTDLKMNALRNETNSNLAFNGLLKNVRTPDQLGFDVAFDGKLARTEILGYVPDTLVTNVLRLPAYVQVNGTAKGTVQDAAAKVNIALGDLGKISLDGTLRDSSYQMKLLAQNLRVGQLAADTSLSPIKILSFNAKVEGTGFEFGKTARVKLAGQVDSVIWDNLILRDLTFDGDVQGKRFTAGFQSPDERAAVKLQASGDFSTAIPLLKTDIYINCMDLREFGWANRPTVLCMHLMTDSEGLSLDTLKASVKIEMIDLQYDTVHIRPGNLNMEISLDNRHNQISILSDWLQGEIKGYFELSELPETIANIAEQYFVQDRTNYIPRTGTDSLFVQLQLLQPEILTTGLIPGLTELKSVSIEGALIAPRNYFNLRIQAPRIVYLGWDIDSLNVRSYAGDTAAMFVVTTPEIKRGADDFIQNVVLNGQFLDNKADVSFKATDKEGKERFLFALNALINSKTKETLVTFAPRQLIDYKEWKVDADNQIKIAPEGVQVQKVILTGDGQSIMVEGSTKHLKANKTGLDFTIGIDRINYNNFDIFLAGLLTDLGGWAEADLKIKGTTDAPQILGHLLFHETHFTPALTNVRYRLSETPIEFTESGIVLDGLTLLDPYDKSLEINGKLTTSDFSNIQSNLTLHADRWQVLNSTKQQNPVYFGELYVSLDGRVRGPASQPDIRVTIKTEKESSFTYVYDVATQALQHEGIVYFLPPPRQYVRPPIYDAPVNTQPFTLSASIEIDSNLTVNSVINPVTGDDFRGKATGKLQLDILSNGNMTLAGQIELVRGVYNYSYQSVVKRSFEVANGSTITWTGDIRSPELDLKARYQFKASPYPLVVNQLSTASAEEAAAYRKSQIFYLQTSLKGSATQPDVSFQFIYPTAQKQESLSSGFGSQQAGLVESALSNVNQDKNQLSKQVFGVLLLRNFVGESFGASTNISGGNPLQSGLSSFLTSQLNALADQYLTWIDIDFSTTEGATNNGASQAEGTTSYQLRLQKSFFEDRLTFKISGGTTVGGSNTNEVHSGLENASVEYALTPKGELKVTVFSEKGFELLNSTSANLRNSGAGIIFTREFGKN